MSNHPVFEIVTTTAGAISIRNRIVNEIMHNPVGPWAEANALYIRQSRLTERLIESQGELVIFDVGLGAAANSLAALACIRSTPGARPVRIVSFEKDLELLRFALAHAERFAHFHGFEDAMKELLEKGSWREPNLIWELRHGNFLELIDREPQRAHLIFYDPYSPNVNQEMWTMSCFEKLHAKSRPESEGGTAFFTYSRATRIRSALIAAGFFVGRGRSTGLKDETTEASTVYERLDEPLGESWFATWQRSHQRYPFDCGEDQKSQVDERIEKYRSRVLQKNGVSPNKGLLHE